MSMDLFESLYHPKWRQLTAQQKLMIITQFLRLYVNPLLSIEKVTVQTFSMGGIKTETISVFINQKEFIFVPGQSEVILGWDMSDKKQRNHSDSFIRFSQQLTSEEELKREHALNRQLSELRKVNISPMLVQVEADLVGYDLIGQMNAVTGMIDLDPEHESLKPEVQQVCEAQLHSVYSRSALTNDTAETRHGKRIMAQLQMDGDGYNLYLAQPKTYNQIRKAVDYLGMELMNEDEWEYATSAGLRYLFRNRTNWPNDDQLFEQILSHRNMFGLKMNDPDLPLELTDQPGLLKSGLINETSNDPLLKYIGQMNFYREIDHKIERQPDQYELLPGQLSYRPIIRLTLPE